MRSELASARFVKRAFINKPLNATKFFFQEKLFTDLPKLFLFD